MIDVPLAYAFTAGLVAAVNPCGFPMLPAYLSWFIGTDDESTASRIPRALGSGLAVSVGFMAVFLALGIPIDAGATQIYEVMPWLTIVIGVALFALGVAMLRGRSLKLSLPRLDRGGKSRGFGSMALFGASYAIASLGCTLPLFIPLFAARTNLVSGVVAFLVYGFGMSLVVLALSIAIALARDSMVRRMRAVLQYVDRIAGVLLVVVGTYLVYYGIYAIDTDSTSSTGVALIDEWSSDLSLRLQETNVKWALVLVVAAGCAWALGRRRRS